MRDLELIVIEDDPTSQVIYIDALHSTRCHLSFCSTVTLAVSLTKLIKPDVVIVDLLLPDGDGVQAIEEILNSDLGRELYILVITSSDDIDLHQRAINAGAHQVMTKPISETELQRTLQRVAETLD